MRKHVDPFPAVSDLFAGLVIATFGGLMLFAGLQPGPGEGPGPRNPVDVEAEHLQQEAQAAIEKYLGGHARPCGGDVCVDVAVQFSPDKDNVPSDYGERLGQACEGLRKTVENHPKELEISIEGHTDSTQPKNTTGRDLFLYNWRLSAMRASSVLYEFKTCGLAPPEYKIVALGYADTQPIGTDDKNRRTTFRLRPDRAEIAKRVSVSR